MVTLARPGLVTPLGPGLSRRPGEGGAAGEAEGELGLLPTTPPICTIHTCQELFQKNGKVKVCSGKYLNMSLLLRNSRILETRNESRQKKSLSKTGAVATWDQRHVHLVMTE